MFSVTLSFIPLDSHGLNLAVVVSFEEVSVRNMIGVMKWLSIFFFLRIQASEEVGRSYTEHSARITHVGAQWSLQNKTDWTDRFSRLYQETLLLRRFQLKVLACCLLTRCQYSLTGKNKNRIHQCSCDYQ